MALLALLTGTGCAATHGTMKAELPPMAFATEAMGAPAPPPVLTENHFRGDRAGSIAEDSLREVLAAPVFLEEKARVGIVPVQGSYALDMEVPLPAVTAALADAMDASGEFELASEVSTDFPVDRGISGLRELAARYRCDYLLIYRHRFVDASYMNKAAWGYLTVVGALFLPGNTIESAGVLEATLFDVKTGTLLFTVNERVHSEEQVNIWHNGLKAQWMKRQMLEGATQKLADQVVTKIRRLVVARPEQGKKSTGAVVSSPPVPSAVPVPVTVSTVGP
ncbi:hypothetical protein [Hyalangium rubrum]|uniref:Lipoprotein n=1 Tax=Hyalangium rubrum TaxID=3103134 RepID=A0ABU5HDT6_9BACT|nr:hypothetical protein [Hyalangium sp. s54d21]MDY7231435.1 hypothetical protein [Hyalangium sp. s54d21]